MTLAKECGHHSNSVIGFIAMTFGISDYFSLISFVKSLVIVFILSVAFLLSSNAHANVRFANTGSNIAAMNHCDSTDVFPDADSLFSCVSNYSQPVASCPDNLWVPYSYVASGTSVTVSVQANMYSETGTCQEKVSYWADYISGTQTSDPVNSCPTGSVLQNGTCVSQFKMVTSASHDANDCRCTKGDPTDVTTGENILEEQDIAPSSGGVLSFTRYYDSQTPAQDYSTLGHGWHNNYYRVMDVGYRTTNNGGSSYYGDAATACLSGWSEVSSTSYRGLASSATPSYENGLCHLTLNGNVIGRLTLQAFSNGPTSNDIIHTITRPNGSAYVFEQNGSGWQERYGAPVTLAAVSDGWLFTDKDGTQEHYNVAGQLTTITDRAGHIQTLSYDSSGRLSSVSDAYNRQLTFTYDYNSHLVSVTDPNGGTYRYGYDYVFNRLTSVSYPDNTPSITSDNPTRHFLYGDSRYLYALTGITDEKGKRFATWTYDAQQRVSSSEHAGGEGHINFTYNSDGSTTLNYANGGIETYHFSVINGSLKVSSVTHQ